VRAKKGGLCCFSIRIKKRRIPHTVMNIPKTRPSTITKSSFQNLHLFPLRTKFFKREKLDDFSLCLKVGENKEENCVCPYQSRINIFLHSG